MTSWKVSLPGECQEGHLSEVPRVHTPLAFDQHDFTNTLLSDTGLQTPAGNTELLRLLRKLWQSFRNWAVIQVDFSHPAHRGQPKHCGTWGCAARPHLRSTDVLEPAARARSKAAAAASPRQPFTGGSNSPANGPASRDRPALHAPGTEHPGGESSSAWGLARGCLSEGQARGGAGQRKGRAAGARGRQNAMGKHRQAMKGAAWPRAATALFPTRRQAAFSQRAILSLCLPHLPSGLAAVQTLGSKASESSPLPAPLENRSVPSSFS